MQNAAQAILIAVIMVIAGFSVTMGAIILRDIPTGTLRRRTLKRMGIVILSLTVAMCAIGVVATKLDLFIVNIYEIAIIVGVTLLNCYVLGSIWTTINHRKNSKKYPHGKRRFPRGRGRSRAQDPASGHKLPSDP